MFGPIYISKCLTLIKLQLQMLLVGVPYRSPSLCSTNCSCISSAFNPVCGSDALEYISPCHAGCTNFTKDSNNTFRIQVSLFRHLRTNDFSLQRFLYK